jgi:hypothetical protein
MGEIVNLRRAKKAKARLKADEEAGANRLLHGTPKGLRDLTKARSEKTRRDLEAGRIEPDKPLKN